MRVLSILAGMAIVLVGALLVGALAMCDTIDLALGDSEEWWI